MPPPEWIALVYFACLAATAAIGPFARVRTRVLARSALVIFVIVVVGQQPSGAAQHVRDWLPGVYAVVGYWIPGMLAGVAVSESTGSTRSPYDRWGRDLERWLASIDARLLPAIERVVMRGPRALLEYLELSYLSCYALVPCAFAWLAINGHVRLADRFWTTVLLALYPCYGLVAWLPTRPPRAREPVIAIERRRLAVHRLNVLLLDRVSIRINTFPSGHTAGALAAAAVVAGAMPMSGAVVGVIAISIAIGSVVGRYHYAADAVAGALVAAAAVGASAWWLGSHP